MIDQVRKHLDIFIVIFVALLAYHFLLKKRGYQSGIFGDKRML